MRLKYAHTSKINKFKQCVAFENRTFDTPFGCKFSPGQNACRTSASKSPGEHSEGSLFDSSSKKRNTAYKQHRVDSKFALFGQLKSSSKYNQKKLINNSNSPTLHNGNYSALSGASVRGPAFFAGNVLNQPPEHVATPLLTTCDEGAPIPFAQTTAPPPSLQVFSAKSQEEAKTRFLMQMMASQNASASRNGGRELNSVTSEGTRTYKNPLRNLAEGFAESSLMQSPGRD